VILWFAVTIFPLAGSAMAGICSYGRNPCQSYFAFHPGTGTRPRASLSARRIGTRAGATNPMWPSRSANTTFCCGAVNSRPAACSSATVRARFNAKPARATTFSSVSAAHASASTCPFGAASPADFTASEITGPWRVARTVMRRSSEPTRITSWRDSNFAVPVGVT
jgi:hypothetical protein